MKRRGLINNKRGEALPLNVIIIAIIVIVVLVVVLLIFIGGIAGLQDKFKSKADDSVLAARECENYCANIQDELNPQVVQRSAFCNKVYRLDVAPLDGKIDTDPTSKKQISYYCDINNKKPDISSSEIDGVGVSCPSIDCSSGNKN